MMVHDELRGTSKEGALVLRDFTKITNFSQNSLPMGLDLNSTTKQKCQPLTTTFLMMLMICASEPQCQHNEGIQDDPGPRI
jgi:hypothetical protein